MASVEIRAFAKVICTERDRLLALAVRARPLVSAVATFSVVGNDTVSVVSFEEVPSPGMLGSIVRPILDPLTHVHNHQSLKRLADFVHSLAPPRGGAISRRSTP